MTVTKEASKDMKALNEASHMMDLHLNPNQTGARRFKSRPVLRGIAGMAMVAVLVTQAARADDLLFLDTFTVSAGSVDVSFEYDAAGRQSGSLAPLTYSQFDGGQWFDFASQVGHSANPGAMLLTAADYNPDTQGRVSPDYNFDVAGTTRISLDVIPGDTSWQAINFGADASGRNQWILDGSAAFGILFKPDGVYEAYDGGVGVGSASYTASPGTNSILIEISDTDGNPWDGVGSTTIDVYADGSSTPFLSYTKAAGGYTDNYITLQAFGSYNNGFVDNLSVSVEPIPEPTTAALSVAGILALTSWGLRRRQRREAKSQRSK